METHDNNTDDGPSPPKRPKVKTTTPSRCSTAPKNPYSSGRRRCKSDDSSDDVQVTSPPPPPRVAAIAPNDNDEVVVESCNATNPNVIFPHLRPHCGVYSFQETPENHCDKCYCVTCNNLASNCPEWQLHCRVTKTPSRPEKEDEDDDLLELPDFVRTELEVMQAVDRMQQQATSRCRHHQDMGRGGRKERDMRVTEILAKKLNDVLKISQGSCAATNEPTTTRHQDKKKMEGDIPQLGLQKSFFVKGVRIGWPFPVIMTPQRQMAIHIITALQNKHHVVLESPTGTGKSVAILCSVLAWQRFHAKTTTPDSDGNNKTPKIIYCSRTHSQVAQMVASLKKTPYRPRMTVLGSRDRLCIHKAIVNRGGTTDQNASKRVNVNLACQTRVRNTENIRRSLYKSPDFHYNEDDPPLEFPGDEVGCGNEAGNTQEAIQEQDDNDNKNQSPAQNTSNWIMSRSTKKATCPHYRQLSTLRNAVMASSRFVLNQDKIDCCQVGGESTRLGVHDIEDLVNFGSQPRVEQGVAIYRTPGTGSFGMRLEESDEGCIVNELVDKGAAAMAGTVKPRDRVLRINGKNIRDWKLDQIVEEIKGTASDPLVLDLVRDGGQETVLDEEETHSPHSSCPYYLSRALSKHAELIFCPYNYVLDPHIRKSLEIELEGSIVVLDEAHNVEDTLKESGSGKFGEFELCEIVSLLSFHSRSEKSGHNTIEIPELGVEMDLSEVAHDLLLFVEKLINVMRKHRMSFENSPGTAGAAAAIEEYKRFHTPDDHEFELKYNGPSGYGVRNEAVGCKPFFDDIHINVDKMSSLVAYAEAIGSRENGNNRMEDEGGAQGSSTVWDRLSEMIAKFSFAMQSPEHYYVSCVAQANGSLDFASGVENESSQTRGSRFKKKPKSLPFAHPRSALHKDLPLPVCLHQGCRRGTYTLGSGVRHCDYCDGSTPKWETHLVLRLLWPGALMEQITKKSRSVILASGSLAPVPSLCGELSLFPPKEHSQSATPPTKLPHASTSNREVYGRLQVRPTPLEADHVIDLKKQLFAVSIGHFPCGSPLKVTYSNYKKQAFFPELGKSIATVIEAIPRGGVLVFFPSYSFLRNCIKCWNPFREFGSRYNNRYDEHECPEIWVRFLQSKGKVIVEPTGSQEKFEEAKREYSDKIKADGNCILLAVFRGKMSEGISFNDDNARGVICVGLPLPNAKDRAIKAKEAYNDEQRRLKGRTALLPGREWYSQQAYRAIGQALGRCIRHAADYGTVVLMDSRHCDDGSPVDRVCSAHQKLPKWMRHHVRTLRMGRTNLGNFGGGTSAVFGGYQGLSQELRTFFAQAPQHSQGVLDKCRSDFKAARARESDSIGHSFDSKTGSWKEHVGKIDKGTKQSGNVAATKPGTISPFFKTTQESPKAVNDARSDIAEESPVQTSQVMCTPNNGVTVFKSPPSSIVSKRDEEAVQDENSPNNVAP